MSLTRLGSVIEYKTLVNKVGITGIHKIKKMFTIVHVGHNNVIKTISSYKLMKHNKEVFIVLPRFGGFMLEQNKLIPEMKNKLQVGKTIDIKKLNLKLTENQQVVLNHLVNTIYTPNNIKNGKSSTILKMDPGYGKTYLSLGVINYIGKKTMVIVPNTYLLKQWVEILTNSFPNNKIGCYYGVKKEDGDIVVSIVNSALKFPNYKDFGLIVYDEVHMYCSSKSATIFSKAQSACCLGITATPTDRIDSFDPVSHWALGKVIHAENIKGWNPANVNFSTSATRVIYDGHKDYTQIIESVTGVVSVPLMINQLQEDPYRNKLIVAYAIHLYKTGRNVFVFSDRREHLHTLANILREQEIEFEAPELNEIKKTKLSGIKELMGGSSEADIESAKKIGRIIMTTYQYSGTGVSINKMNSLILATPRKSNMRQILGRIFRLSSDQSIKRSIIDIVDNRICLKSQYYTRKKTYINTLKADIQDKKIKWQDCDNIKNILEKL